MRVRAWLYWDISTASLVGPMFQLNTYVTCWSKPLWLWEAAWFIFLWSRYECFLSGCSNYIMTLTLVRILTTGATHLLLLTVPVAAPAPICQSTSSVACPVSRRAALCVTCNVQYCVQCQWTHCIFLTFLQWLDIGLNFSLHWPFSSSDSEYRTFFQRRFQHYKKGSVKGSLDLVT